MEIDGFVVDLEADGLMLCGVVRDTHTVIEARAADLPSLKAELHRKIYDYVQSCDAAGMSPFDTPDGTSTKEFAARMHKLAFRGVQAPRSRPDEWPHAHPGFFLLKAKLLATKAEEAEPFPQRVPPGLRIPLDDILDELRQRTRPPRVVVFRRGQATGNLNTYARFRVSHAFDVVRAADPREHAERRAFGFEFLEASQKLSAAATEFLRRFRDPEMTFPTFARGHAGAAATERFETAHAAELHLVRFLAELSKLRSFAYDDLDDVAPMHGGRPRLDWKYDFVAVIADLWCTITDSPPSPNPGGFFLRLVDAAWNSGGDDMPEVSWERVVRTFCKEQKG